MLTSLFRHKAKIALLLVILLVGWCLWNWQPERQVRLHQRHLLEAAQKRNWKKLNSLLDESFLTPCKQDKIMVLKNLDLTLRPFLTVQITNAEDTMTLDDPTGQIRSIIRINGNGTQLATEVKNLVNQSNEPFEFTWKRVSWKPWDWRLVSVSHKLIALGAQPTAL